MISSWAGHTKKNRQLSYRPWVQTEVSHLCINFTLSMGLRICWLYPLQRGVRAPPTKEKGCSGYAIKLHLVVMLQFWDLGNVEYPLSGSTC